MIPYSTGGDSSQFDIRDFAYKPSGVPWTGGKRYDPKDIEDQYKVGICTAISFTQNARKALGVKFSADFQYLLQKKMVDGNWNEGSALSSSLKVGQKYGLLPEKYWKFTKDTDRKLGYTKYIKKLQAVTDKDIEKLLRKTIKISAYAKVPVDRDLMAQAINESKSGILCRFAIGKEWWTKPIEPIQPPKQITSGHAVTESNYDGSSFRIANTWGTDWASGGTAYRLQKEYKPTEAWAVYYDDVPDVIKSQLDSRQTLKGKGLNIIQSIIKLFQ